jgi:uncharacterized protein (DUF2267 family)
VAVSYEQFIALVARRAQLSTDTAERATRAVLQTLAERLTPGEVTDLLDGLPIELAAWFHRVPGRAPEPFDVDEFLTRVAAREGTNLPAAELHARAVFAALREVIDQAEVRDLVADLPDDFRPIVLNLAIPSADEIVADVARRAEVDEAEAWRATESVLETLAERVSSGEVRDLLSRLPVRLHAPLRRGLARAGDEARRLDADQFLARVAWRSDVGVETARRYVRAVLGALRDAIGGEEFADVEAELPPDYAPLIPMP